MFGMDTAKAVSRLDLKAMTLEDKILGGYFKT